MIKFIFWIYDSTNIYSTQETKEMVPVPSVTVTFVDETAVKNEECGPHMSSWGICSQNLKFESLIQTRSFYALNPRKTKVFWTGSNCGQ